MDAVRETKERPQTHSHAKKKRYEERVSSCQQLQAAENECWNSRRGKKKRKRERERRGRTVSSYERDGKSFLEARTFSSVLNNSSRTHTSAHLRVFKKKKQMSSSCAQTQATLTRHQFKGRVGKTSLKNKASCSTSSSSSSAALFSSSSSRRRGGAVKCFAISKPWDVQKPCKLVLEDGSVWQGKAFGADGTKVGEVVFNTSLSGYEILSLFVVVVVVFFLPPRIKTSSGRPFASGGVGLLQTQKIGRQRNVRIQEKKNSSKKKEISPPPPLFLSVHAKIYARAKTKRMIIVINALTLINIHSFPGFNYKTGTKKS